MYASLFGDYDVWMYMHSDWYSNSLISLCTVCLLLYTVAVGSSKSESESSKISALTL